MLHSEDLLQFVNSRLYKAEICLFSFLPKPQCLEQCPVQRYVTEKKNEKQKTLNEFSKCFYTHAYYGIAHSKYQVIIKLIIIIIHTSHGLSANNEEGSVLSALHTEFHLILLMAQ